MNHNVNRDHLGLDLNKLSEGVIKASVTNTTINKETELGDMTIEELLKRRNSKSIGDIEKVVINLELNQRGITNRVIEEEYPEYIV